MQGLGVRSGLGIFVWILGILVLVFGGATYFTINYLNSLPDKWSWVRHTYEVLDTAEKLLFDLQYAEATQRGFVITQHEEYLQPYYAAIERLPPSLRKLRDLTMDSPTQQKRIAELEPVLQTKLAELATTLNIVRRDGPAAGQVSVAANIEKRTMNEVRRIVAEIVAEERGLLRTRSDEAFGAERSTFVSTLLLLGATLLLVAIGALLILRTNLQLTRAQRKLASQANLLQGTLDNTREGIAMFGADGRLAAWNWRFFKLTGLDRALAVAGQPIARLHEAEAARPEKLLPALSGNAAVSTRAPEEGLMRKAQFNGRELEIYQNAVPDGGAIVTVTDVTRRSQAEAVARQAQKMEAIGQLTGGIAHDYNNLLQVVRGNLDLLAIDAKGHEKTLKRVQNALAGTDRGAQLTRQLLAFARRQPLQPVSVNPARLVQEMAELLHQTLGEQIEIETVIGAGLWATLADPNQLQGAILNLAINARDAMPDGGKLTIEVANASLDEAYAAQQGDVTPGQYVMIAVTDTGAGMSPDVVAHAFEPFFTTKAEGKGSGLGLAQVYGFVKQSAGHIKIYSELGQGTTMKIYLPRTRRAEDRIGASVGEPLVGGKESILVVEDDDNVRKTVVELVASLGYRVLEADGSAAALAKLESDGAVDLMLTDVVMPGPLKARDLVREAHKRQSGLAVLFTSGYTENAIIHHGKLDDDVFLLSKPYNREELANKIRIVLAAHRAGAAPKATDAAKQ